MPPSPPTSKDTHIVVIVSAVYTALLFMYTCSWYRASAADCGCVLPPQME